MNGQHHLVWALALAVGVSRAWAAPPPPTSLNNCQNAVKTATKQFVTNKVMALGTCLQAVSTQIVKKNAADASGAASSCVTQFRKINDGRGLNKQLSDKLAAAIVKQCAPGQPNVTHTLADIIGAGAGVLQPLDAENLNAWCSHYGGDGSIDTLQEWIDCLTVAAECDVDAAIAAQYPRVLDWLNLVKPKMQALSPPAADPTKISDAVAGLDAVRAEIDGPDNDNIVSIQCGGPRSQPLKTGQTIAYGTGSDGDLQKGDARSYTDNGDGTITDNSTGLMWEKKDQSGGVHDYGKAYTWCSDVSPVDGVCDTAGNPMDGTLVTMFLAALNAGAGFAGHTDWRIPNVNELQSLENSQNFNPSVNQAFNLGCAMNCTVTDCSCTQPAYHLSSSTVAPFPDHAWLVDFYYGFVNYGSKSVSYYVRAVRGGS